VSAVVHVVVVAPVPGFTTAVIVVLAVLVVVVLLLSVIVLKFDVINASMVFSIKSEVTRFDTIPMSSFATI
jgi:hypothetical protein